MSDSSNNIDKGTKISSRMVARTSARIFSLRVAAFRALILALLAPEMCSADDVVAFKGAQGFGAISRGGARGRVLKVTTLDDKADDPPKGSLRWAVEQKGPRVVRFDVVGNIRLKAPLVVSEPYLTIDGLDSPGGVCLCDYGLSINDTHDVIVRHLRLRRGDRTTLAEVESKGLERPRGSSGLDTVSANRSQNILFDHCSLSWSCDEIFGIVGCQNVTIQWCIISEPLANPRLHPYGDRHAFGLNLSASTLSLHHCLIAHYVMRGPQFEANDVHRGQDYDVEMEAINNVMFDYERSGSRYTTGIENNPDEADGVAFRFQFINNTYVSDDADRPPIEAVTRHGVIDRLKVYSAGNALIVGKIGSKQRSDDESQVAGIFVDKNTPIARAEKAVRRQVVNKPMVGKPLFAAPMRVAIEPADVAYRRVLEEAGCGPSRDAVDLRIVQDVLRGRFGGVIRSQDDVGGWPELK